MVSDRLLSHSKYFFSRFLPAVFLLLLCTASIAAGQSMAGLGAIHGTVTDASGAVVPGAKVVVSNAALGITREVLASSDGVFEAPSLPPAEGYKVTVSMTGFSTYVATGIGVHVGQDIAVPIEIGRAHV